MNNKVLLKESCSIAAHEPVSAGGKPRDLICEIMIEMALLTIPSYVLQWKKALSGLNDDTH